MPLGYFGGFLKEWLSPVSQCRHLGQSPPPPLPVGCPLTQSFLPFQPVRSVPKTLPRGLLHEKGNYWSGDTGGFWAEEHMLSLPLTGSHCCCVKNKLQGARAAARTRQRLKLSPVCRTGDILKHSTPCGPLYYKNFMINSWGDLNLWQKSPGVDGGIMS